METLPRRKNIINEHWNVPNIWSISWKALNGGLMQGKWGEMLMGGLRAQERTDTSRRQPQPVTGHFCKFHFVKRKEITICCFCISINNHDILKSNTVKNYSYCTLIPRVSAAVYLWKEYLNLLKCTQEKGKLWSNCNFYIQLMSFISENISCIGPIINVENSSENKNKYYFLKIKTLWFTEFTILIPPPMFPSD